MKLILPKILIAATALLLSTIVLFGQPSPPLPKALDGFEVHVALLEISPRPRVPFDKVPVPLYQPMPNYPINQYGDGKRHSGFVIFRITVDKQGKVQNCERPIHAVQGFWEPVKEAVKKWTFSMPPKADNSDDTSIRLTYIIHFIKCNDLDE